MLAQDASHQTAQVGAHVLPHGPVNRDVALDGPHQLPRDVTQRLVAQHLHRAVVGLQRVVEGQLVIRQPQPLAARVGLPHVSRKLDQLLDHLRRLDRAILVAAQGLFQHLGEGASLHHVLAPSD